MKDYLIGIIRSGKTTVCGLILVGFAGAEFTHTGQLTANSMMFIVSGVGLMLGRDFNVSRLP